MVILLGPDPYTPATVTGFLVGVPNTLNHPGSTHPVRRGSCQSALLTILSLDMFHVSHHILHIIGRVLVV